METITWYTLEEITDKYIGKKGSLKRTTFDANLEAALIGATIKEAREAQHLTQKELGERIGMLSTQISKIENGQNPTLAAIIRALHALNLTANFSIQGFDTITIGK